MAASLKNMLAIARMKLKDMSVRMFPEPELIASANEGKNEVVKIIRQAREDYFLKSTTATIPIATAPNASEITLPTDFAELKEILVTTAGYEDIQFQYKDFAQFDFRQALIDGGSFGNGQGTFYYDIVGDRTLRLSPGSDLALAVTIQYIPTVADMVLPNDYPVGLPYECYDFIVTWIICEGLRSLADPRLDSYESKLEYQRQSIINGINQRQVREPEFVHGYQESEQW